MNGEEQLSVKEGHRVLKFSDDGRGPDKGSHSATEGAAMELGFTTATGSWVGELSVKRELKLSDDEEGPNQESHDATPGFENPNTRYIQGG